MTDYINKKQDITWKSPSGKSFTLKTLESGYSRKHIGDVKENPRTSYSSSSSTRSGGSKKSKTSSSSSVSTSSGTKRVGDSNDTFSDLGISGKDISLDCLFTGSDHDILAQNFVDALCEVGKSSLRLAYGDEFTVNVLSFSVKNNLVENINLTTVSVNFHQTAQTTYPQSSESSVKEVQTAASSANLTAAENFEAAVNNAALTQTRLSSFTSSYNAMMSKVSAALSAANSLTIKSILSDIMGQDLVTNSLTMASQLQIVISQAMTLNSKVKNLVSEFNLSGSSSGSSVKNSTVALLDDLKTNNTTAPLTTAQVDNLIINDTTAQAVLTAMAEDTAATDFITRQEALDAVNELIDAADDWNDYVDEEYQKIEDLSEAFVRDTGINEVVLSAVDAVIEKSYNLKIEKTIILTEDEPPVNIAYQYYPEDFTADPEAAVEYLVSSNGWGDDMFYLIPRGTEVKIYV